MDNKFRLIEGNCVWCGKFFSRKQYIIKQNHGLFCSIKCSKLWHGEQCKEIRFCTVCGQEFMVRRSDYKMTCSPECKKKNMSNLTNQKQREARSKTGKENKGRKYPERTKPLIKKICIQCGKEYFLGHKFSNAFIKSSRFCTKDCWYEYIRGDVTRHPAWKGGYQPYYGPNWNKQRRAARKRDNYICQDCGKSEGEIGQELDVHHVISFRLFGVEHFKKANCLSNLVSLCKSCHSRRQK